ncbi:hypothetical protein D3C72_1995480 [compost metagenome]
MVFFVLGLEIDAPLGARLRVMVSPRVHGWLPLVAESLIGRQRRKMERVSKGFVKLK